METCREKSFDGRSRSGADWRRTGGHAADLHGGMKGSPMLPEPPAESSKSINWTAILDRHPMAAT